MCHIRVHADTDHDSKGRRKHGKEAEAALIVAEFAQFENLNAYESIDPRSVAKDQNECALRAINLLMKEKRDGRLKGQTVADRRPQGTIYEKAESASPTTMPTDALVLSIITDAHEERDVLATADVAGVYLKADMDDFVSMKVTNDSVDILCNSNLKHKQFVTKTDDIKLWYLRFIKAIFGCVKSAL